MARLSTLAIATGVSAGDVTDLQADVATLQSGQTSLTSNLGGLAGAVRAGAGFPLVLDPTSSGAGDAAPHEVAMTMPDSGALPVTTGDKYRINGTFTARDGSTILGVRELHDIIVKRTAAPAWEAYGSGSYVVSNKHATFAAYFLLETDFPDISDDGGALSCLYTLANGQVITMEFDGTIANIGANA